jgi:hypothetical protein
MEDKDRFVDELLNSALAHRRGAEPRPGLEGRILERVRAAAGERDAGRKVWKLWLAAGATAAVVLTSVAIYVAKRSHSPAAQTSQASKTVPAPPAREALAANSATTPRAGTATTNDEPQPIARRGRKSLRRIETPRWPSQFPTPAPLTEEQKALVQYVRETPPKVLAEPTLKAEPMVQRVEIKPLEIPPLEIQPLAVGSTKEEIQ